MRLYEPPAKSYFTIVDAASTRVPPEAPRVNCDTVYWFRNIDGVYSYCLDPAGEVVHVFAGADVTPCEAPARLSEKP